MSVLLNGDGTAHVAKIPLSPFTGYQHGRIDVLAAARVSGYMRRLAFEHGWLQAADPAEAADATGFFVACDTRLEDSSVLSKFITPRSICEGDLLVSSIGTSSFSLLVCLRATVGSEQDAVQFCRMSLTYVHVNKASRRPAPIPPGKRKVLEESYALSLPRRESYRAASLERLVVPAEISPLLVVAGPIEGAYERRFHLREQDFDFNKHMNQSMYQSFVLDTLKQACRLQLPAFVWAMQAVGTDDATPLFADLAVSALRIDYKQEVPLAALDGTLAVRIVGSESTRLVWFAVCAVEGSGVASTFQAALGFLSIRSPV